MTTSTAERMLPGLSILLARSARADDAADAIVAAAAAAAHASRVFEIVVVDGFADDAAVSAALLRDRRLPVRLLVHPHARGYRAAVRTGVEAARMRWVLLASAAERLEPRALTVLAAAAPSADVVVGRRAPDRQPGPVRAARDRIARALLGVPVGDADALLLIRRELLAGIPLRTGGVLVRAELLVRCRAAGARIAEPDV